MDLGVLKAKLAIDTSDWESGMSKAKGEMKSLGKAAGVVTGAIAGVGAAAAKVVTDFANVADEAAKAAKRVGISAEAMQELGFAAELSGANMNKIEKGLQKLSKNARDASEGVGPAADAFERLGISATNADGSLKNSLDLMQEVAGQLKGVGTDTERAALAMDLFGKSGADLLPMLNEGADGIAKMRDEARDLGMVIDGETAAAAEAFNDNLSRLSATASGIRNELATELLPVFNAVAEESLAIAQEFRGTVDAGEGVRTTVLDLSDALHTVAPAVTLVTTTVGVAIDGFKTLDIAASSLAIGIGGIVEGALMARAALTESAEATADLESHQAKLAALTQDTRQKIDEWGQATLDGVDAGDKMTEALRRVSEAMRLNKEEAAQAIGPMDDLELAINGFDPDGGNAASGIKKIGEEAKKAVKPLADLFAELDQISEKQTGLAFGGSMRPTNEVDPSQTVQPLRGHYRPEDTNTTPGAIEQPKAPDPVRTDPGLQALSDAANSATSALSGMGEVGTVLTGGLGGLVSVFTDLWMSSKSFQQVLGMVSETFNTVFGPTVEEISGLLIDVLGPVLEVFEALAPIVHMVSQVMMPLVAPLQLLAAAVRPLANAFDWLITHLRKGVAHIRVWFANLTRKKKNKAEVREDGTIYDPKGKIGTDVAMETRRHHDTSADIVEANEATEAESAAGSFTAAADAVDGMTDSVREATKTMTNVPTIFARNLRRSQAGQVSGRSMSQLGAADRAASQTNWYVENQNVYANDPDEMAERTRRQAYVRRGTNVQSSANFVYESV